MNYRMTALLNNLIDLTFDPLSKITCAGRMADALGLSESRIKNRVKQEDILFDNALEMFDYLGYEVYAQHDNTLIPLTSTESAITSIRVILAQTKLSKVELAKRLKVTYVALMQFFKQANVKSRTLVKTFNALDYQIIVTSKVDNDKSYIIGDDCVELYKHEVMYKEALETLSRSPIKQEPFFDRFIQDCIVSDWENTETIPDIYQSFQNYWLCHPEHPTRVNLGKKDFRKLLVDRFNIIGEKCYGIKLKGEAL